MGQVCRWTLAFHGCIALNYVCIRFERESNLFLSVVMLAKLQCWRERLLDKVS